MSTLTRWLDPLRHAAVAFFKHDLALRRADDGLHVVLEQRSEPAARSKPRRQLDPDERKARQDLELVRAELAALLRDYPQARQAMLHLMLLERALAKRGWRALNKMPLDVLRRAHEQLEGAVTNWSPLGLATLRSKLAVAVIQREQIGPEPTPETPRSEALVDTLPLSLLPEVEEHSDDDALAAAYAALGDVAPEGVQMQGELGSPSARKATARHPQPTPEAAEITVRVLQD